MNYIIPKMKKNFFFFPQEEVMLLADKKKKALFLGCYQAYVVVRLNQLFKNRNLFLQISK